MFTNYYDMLHVSSDATIQEINTAIEKSRGLYSQAVLEEMQMVLLNQSLRSLYDEEFKLYLACESKQDYLISNPILEREIKKVRLYVSHKNNGSLTKKEIRKKYNYSWLWLILAVIIGLIIKGISSYNKGETLEENAQKFQRGEYGGGDLTSKRTYFTSENAVIADDILTLRSELPIEISGLGPVQRVEDNCDTVYFKMKIQEDDVHGLFVTKINNKTKIAKELVSAQIGMMNEKIKKALQNIAEHTFHLKVIVKGTISTQDGVIDLNSQEIMSALASQSNQSIDEFSLKMQVMSTKLVLPLKTNDEAVLWNDENLTASKFILEYQVNESITKISDIDFDILKAEIIEEVKKDEVFMKKIVQYCKATHRDIIYRYIGSHSKKIVDVMISIKEIESAG